MHGLSSLEVYCSTFPQYSHLTWLLSRLSLSLSGLTELSSASELRLGQRSTHRGLHFTQPAPLWPRRHSQSCWSISGMAIHHFVLLKVFDCPAQLSGAASACSAILLHRWKCLTLRAQTWASSFPSCLFLCRLSWQSAKAEVRCVVLFTAKMAT